MANNKTGKSPSENRPNTNSIYHFLIRIHSDWAFYLSDREYRVLMFILMRTAAWKKEVEGIAVSHFLSGVWTTNLTKENVGSCIIQPIPGRHGATPMSRSALMRVLSSLERKGMILRWKTGRATVYGVNWSGPFAEDLHADLFGGGRNRTRRKQLQKNSIPLPFDEDELEEDPSGQIVNRQFRVRTEGGVAVEQQTAFVKNVRGRDLERGRSEYIFRNYDTSTHGPTLDEMEATFKHGKLSFDSAFGLAEISQDDRETFLAPTRVRDLGRIRKRKRRRKISKR